MMLTDPILDQTVKSQWIIAGSHKNVVARCHPWKTCQWLLADPLFRRRDRPERGWLKAGCNLKEKIPASSAYC